MIVCVCVFMLMLQFVHHVSLGHFLVRPDTPRYKFNFIADVVEKIAPAVVHIELFVRCGMCVCVCVCVIIWTYIVNVIFKHVWPLSQSPSPPPLCLQTSSVWSPRASLQWLGFYC